MHFFALNWWYSSSKVSEEIIKKTYLKWKRECNDGKSSAHILNASFNCYRSSNGVFKTEDGRRNKTKRKAKQWQEKFGHVESSWNIIENVRKDKHFQSLTNDYNGKTGNTTNLMQEKFTNLKLNIVESWLLISLTPKNIVDKCTNIAFA